jgi:hypothetical protein
MVNELSGCILVEDMVDAICNETRLACIGEATKNQLPVVQEVSETMM